MKTAGIAVSASVFASEDWLGDITTSLSNPPDTRQPRLPQGMQIGDVIPGQAVIWSRTDRPARMYVKYSLDSAFKNSTVVEGPIAHEQTDYIARVNLTGLPTGQAVFLQVIFQNLNFPKIMSKPAYGYFRTAPAHENNIRFLWSGDVCGQGWGINPDIGGMKIFDTMRLTDPDFFIHCGDAIYADCPIQESQRVNETGELWRNLVTQEVLKVAETLNEFRGRYKYNLLDTHLRRFNAQVPTVRLWDDHEVTNNWSPSKTLQQDDRYVEKNLSTLMSRGARAALEYAPIRYQLSHAKQRIYRHLPYGPLLDIFVLDMRSYRAGNNYNRQDKPGSDTAYLGREQLNWLKASLKKSSAVWKVIAADMPLGLQLGDGFDKQQRRQFENSANGDGPVLGREFEIAELLAYLKQEKITNTVWFTADVHYCAAHYYDPDNAVFKDFDPFWEFVSGPLNAGSFQPHPLDNTFGPQLIFQKASPSANLSPLAGLQFFGQVDINAVNRVMTVQLKDMAGETLFTQEIFPALT